MQIDETSGPVDEISPGAGNCPPPGPAPWRSYPYVLVADDPELIFPAAEGHQGAATDSYYASGILRGEETGRRYAFLTIFVKNEEIFDLLSADFYVLALFDLDAGTYQTMSWFDVPPGRPINRDHLDVTRGRLDVRYDSPAGFGQFRARRDGGQLYAFAYELALSGVDGGGTPVQLRLCADALKPPQAVGSPVYNGSITVYGQPNTHSYYQSLGYAGTLSWGAAAERVSGQIGWLDRQWFPEYAGTYAGPLADRYGHQWTQLSLDNGWELSLWRHFDRRNQDSQVPFSGLMHTDPSGATGFTEDYAIEIASYVRDPDTVEPLLAPLQDLAGIRSSIRYFFDSFRLSVPSLDLDVVSTPLVAAPAHAMPIDYFSGPTLLAGTMQGMAVQGYGFHERTLPLSRPRQLMVVLRDSLLYLPAAALVNSPLGGQQLADLAWRATPQIDRCLASSALPSTSFMRSVRCPRQPADSLS